MNKYKYIPPSYYELCKEGVNHPKYWKDFRSDNQIIMLGGEYTERQSPKPIEQGFIKLLDYDDNNSSYKYKSDLKKVGEIEKCPFVVGANVKFNFKCPQSDIIFLKTINQKYDFDNTEIAYKIDYILNGYYVFINCPSGVEDGFPFRWIDLEKA